jgi:hypothetical protein
VEADLSAPGVLVTEAFDDGWRAEIDGRQGGRPLTACSARCGSARGGEVRFRYRPGRPGAGFACPAWLVAALATLATLRPGAGGSRAAARR